MSVLSATNPTLLDVASRMEDGKVASIVELLAETNEILPAMTFLEANDGSSHKTTVRSGLPSATWRLLNYGVQPSKSTTVQVKDSCGMLETYSKIDKALIDLAVDKAGFRMSEDRAFIEGMNQSFMDTLIYGNTSTNPERFMGLAPRFNSLSAENGGNIIDGGGAASDNTSVWIAVLGPNTLHGIYPKGSKAGLSHEDRGQQTVTLSDGSMYEAMVTHYKWDAGLVLRDWRYVVRVANIKTSTLTKDAASGADLIDLIVQGLEKIPNLSMGRPVIICNRTIKSFLRRQVSNKDNVNLSLDQVAGKHVLAFDGIPVLRCDAILDTEATVA
jgi:hypothetical protein